MKIIGTLETVATGEIEPTEVECTVYGDGLAAMKRTLEEGVRLIAIRVER